MGISDNIIGNIIGSPRPRGGRKDWDGDGVPNKKDCQPRNTMRQDTYIFFGEKGSWMEDGHTKETASLRGNALGVGFRRIGN